MKPTKEQIIEWTTLAYEKLAGHRLDQNEVRQALESDPETLEAAIVVTTIAIAAAYAKGQEDMRNQAEKVCDDLERAKWEGRIAFAGPEHCATGIRALPIQKGGED